MHPIGRGRPGTEVIPTEWEATHRPVIDATLIDATVEIRQPGSTTVWDPADEQNVAVPNAPYYNGPARVQAMRNDARTATAADDTETVAGYFVTLTADTTGVAGGHLVTVTACEGDTDLVGTVLQVDDVVLGSLRFERLLHCSLTS